MNTVYELPLYNGVHFVTFHWGTLKWMSQYILPTGEASEIEIPVEMATSLIKQFCRSKTFGLDS